MFQILKICGFNTKRFVIIEATPSSLDSTGFVNLVIRHEKKTLERGGGVKGQVFSLNRPLGDT